MTNKHLPINRGKYDEYKINGVSLEILHSASNDEKEKALKEFKRILEVNKVKWKINISNQEEGLNL